MTHLFMPQRSFLLAFCKHPLGIFILQASSYHIHFFHISVTSALKKTPKEQEVRTVSSLCGDELSPSSGLNKAAENLIF